MNKGWSELNKSVNSLLNKQITFGEGIIKLIKLRKMLFSELFNLMKNISKEDYSKQSFVNSDGYESKTIAYSIYHIFRIEDIVLNTLINNDTQIFYTNDFFNRLNSSISTTGNELVKEQIAEFSKMLNIDELWNYAREVSNKTNEWLTTLSYEQLKTTFSEIDKNRIRETNSVHSNQYGLIEYWCGKNIKGLLGMPFSRHWIMHIEAAIRIKNKITK